MLKRQMPWRFSVNPKVVDGSLLNSFFRTVSVHYNLPGMENVSCEYVLSHNSSPRILRLELSSQAPQDRCLCSHQGIVPWVIQALNNYLLLLCKFHYLLGSHNVNLPIMTSLLGRSSLDPPSVLVWHSYVIVCLLTVYYSSVLASLSYRI